MIIRPFFDNITATVSYIVNDPATKKCAIIDSVLDYNPESGRTNTHSAERLIEYIHENALTVEWILETHLHADHLTAAEYLKNTVGGKTAIGEKIKVALEYWTNLFDTKNDTPLDGSSFDHLFKDNETFNIGNLSVKIMETPGHTPTCLSYLIEDAIFVGDAMLMPYVGTARTDFPGGDAKTLYHSIQKILSLPENTRIFTAHEYPPEGRDPAFESTVQSQNKSNILIHEGISEDAYVTARTQKDQGKPVPRLILPSIQVNLRAGKLGKASDNGIQYMKIPINIL